MGGGAECHVRGNVLSMLSSTYHWSSGCQAVRTQGGKTEAPFPGTEVVMKTRHSGLPRGEMTGSRDRGQSLEGPGGSTKEYPLNSVPRDWSVLTGRGRKGLVFWQGWSLAEAQPRHRSSVPMHQGMTGGGHQRGAPGSGAFCCHQQPQKQACSAPRAQGLHRGIQCTRGEQLPGSSGLLAVSSGGLMHSPRSHSCV